MLTCYYVTTSSSCGDIEDYSRTGKPDFIWLHFREGSLKGSYSCLLHSEKDHVSVVLPESAHFVKTLGIVDDVFFFLLFFLL